VVEIQEINMVEKIRLVIRVFFLKTWIQITGLPVFLFLCYLVAQLLQKLQKLGLITISFSFGTLNSYLQIISSITGTIGAILIGFFFFRFQTIQSDLKDWYIEIQREVDKFTKILHEIPNRYFELKPILDRAIKHLESIKLYDYPFLEEEDWEIIQRPSNTIFDSQEINSTDECPYKIIASTVRIEEYFKQLNISTIEIIISEFILHLIYKLFAILITSLALMLIFSVIKITHSSANYIYSAIVLSLSYFTFIVIAETVFHFKEYYKNVSPAEESEKLTTTYPAH